MSHRVRAAPGANKVKFIFRGGVYVAKNSLRCAARLDWPSASQGAQRSGISFVRKRACSFPDKGVYDRCALKFPPVRTPSCTMKNAAGSILLTSCCSVSSSYFDTQMHSTCTGSPV